MSSLTTPEGSHSASMQQVLKASREVAGKAQKLAGQMKERAREHRDPDSATASPEWKGTNLYRSVCGDFHHNSGTNEELFWACVEGLIEDHFESLPDEQQAEARVDFVLTSTYSGETGIQESFWRIPDAGPAHLGSDGSVYPLDARRYILGSVYGLLLKRLRRARKERDDGGPSRGREREDSAELLAKLEEQARKILKAELGKALQTKERDKLLLDERGRLTYLHRSALRKLADLQDLVKERDREAFENELFALLERLNSRGNDRASSLEIALLLNVLGGRFLNRVAQCKPRWRAVFHAAIRYVLGRQVEGDGRWVDHERITSKTENPLVHGYSPLVYLLDLGADVLQGHLEELTRATARALESIKRELDEALSEWPAFPQGKETLVRRIVTGLCLGTIAADRFKDLLSGAILDKLGAEVPQTRLAWEHVIDALSLKANLKEGVLDKWVEPRSDRRPGAILFFGPPGTGKTTIARVLCKELNRERQRQAPDNEWKFLALDPADFAREGADRIVACAEWIFDQLRQVRRCVVLLDEMEEFLRIRDPSSDKISRLITTAFLPLLQETVQERESILIVATNFVGDIDPAVTRPGRFDLILPLGPPDQWSRRKILDSFLESGVLAFNGLEDEGVEQILADLATYTMGYTRSEMEDFVRAYIRWQDAQAGEQPDRGARVVELWRLRSSRVPTALSGRAGSNWKVFMDEAKRFARYADDQAPTPEDHEAYWREPKLPSVGNRSPS